ncbi:hypothetical protein [Roseateles sp.]|uniref:hypothetical protein n=1 Tax=Roseateles sp. TaxID=1971397 RepID=UPI0031D6E36C
MLRACNVPSVDTRLASGVGQADDASRQRLDRAIQIAKGQTHFYDERVHTPEKFRRAEELYEQARLELFCTFQWLVDLLPPDSADALVREGIRLHGCELAGLPTHMSEDWARLFGEGKRALLALCRTLEADPRPSHIAAACRELRTAFEKVTPLAESMAASIVDALAAVQSDRTAVRTAAQAIVPERAAPSVPNALRRAVPRNGEEARVAAMQLALGTDEVALEAGRLRAGFDRLIALVPSSHDRAGLRDHLSTWRDRFTSLPDELGGHHLEMLGSGPLILGMLGDELDRMEPDRQQEVLDRLEALVLRQAWANSPAAELAKVLLAAESANTDSENPHLARRQQALRAWTGPQQALGEVSSGQAADAMQSLGLHEPHIVICGPLSEMDTARKNFAWRLCLAPSTGRVDPHPLSDYGRTDLAAAIFGLRKCCADFGVDNLTPLTEFADRWLAQAASGNQDDPVGNLQLMGVGAMKRIEQRLNSWMGDREAVRRELIAMISDLEKAQDPAATLLHFARYRIPDEPRSAEASIDIARRQAIRAAAEASARPLLRDVDEAAKARLIGQACRRLQDLLGVRAADGDTHASDAGGLIDTSSVALHRLNQRVRQAASQALDQPA